MHIQLAPHHHSSPKGSPLRTKEGVMRTQSWLFKTVRCVGAVLALTLGIIKVGIAQTQTAAAPARTAAQLEQLVAPIALYPDALLSQVLIASTYPLDVVAAARSV